MPARRSGGRLTAARSLKAKLGGKAATRKAVVHRRGGMKAVTNLRVAGFAGQELKFFDSVRASLAIPAPTDATAGEMDPATLNAIFCPVQGTGGSNRDGRRCTMTSVQITGLVNVPAQQGQTSADVNGTIFIALVMDKQTNASQLASEDVFSNPSGNASMAASPLRDLERSTRFNVLKVWTMDLPPQQAQHDGTNADLQGYQLRFEGFIKLNTKVEFIANGGTVADTQDNSLHMIAFASTTASAPTLLYQARVRFIG